MQYRQLGQTGIEVSAVAFGAWAIVGDETWGPQDRQAAVQALRTAFENEVTLFDTAEIYGDGESERLLAEALKSVRNRLVIATKVSSRHYEPQALRAACEGSLRNLRTDRIDLYQLHWPNRDIPVADTIGQLETLKAEGKIRAYGVSNFGAAGLSAALASGRPPASDQVAYNLLFRAVEFEVLPACRQAGVSLLCYCPLMQGLLTGKFASPDDVPVGRARSRHFSCSRPRARHGRPGFEQETFEAIARIRAIADGLGQPMANVALAWLLAQPGVASVIAGARDPQQARRNARAGDLVLPPDALRALDDATRDLKAKLGPNADLWQADSRVW